MNHVRWSAAALADLLSDNSSYVEQMLANRLISEGLGRPGPSETQSWRNSLTVLSHDLVDAGLGGVEMILEHRLPMSSKRADVVLAGVGAQSGDPAFTVVELKQWSAAKYWDDGDELFDVPGARYRPVLHPSRQVGSYVAYMRDFLRIFADTPNAIDGIAYLHNASEGSITDLRTSPVSADARLFSAERKGELHGFLQSTFADTSGSESADFLLRSAVAPSRQLLSVASDEIRDREQFVLLDEQRVAYDMVLAAVRKAHDADSKTVTVVTGGPGSGKSVIALSLLGELARQGRTVLHATGSKSFTQTLRKVAGKGSRRTREMFKYFNTFVATEKNSLDVLILDEAHRMRETSVSRFTPKNLRAKSEGRRQVDELLDAARVPVFMLDEHQVVRPGEMGTVADIKTHAATRGLPVNVVDLNAQFRSGGSEKYTQWVHRLLGLVEGGPEPWTGDENFEVRTVGSPWELERRLQQKRDDGYGARMTAGYCWEWNEPRADGTLIDDVSIGDWRRPWNLKSDRAVDGAPPSPLWATDPGGFGQVGCVYTAQGFEYDWNGVIFGPDLVWRTDRWVTRREYSRDPVFKSSKKIDDDDVDQLIRQTYKVLLTRGMVGTLLYSTDEETMEFLNSLV